MLFILAYKTPYHINTETILHINNISYKYYMTKNVIKPY